MSEKILYPELVPQITCAFHRDYKISNFCLAKQCNLPLCPQCVNIHTLEHRENGSHGDYETLSDTISYLLVDSNKILDRL